jgi:fructoselysine-6-P-deglycase FrlB-like protein
VSFVAEEIATQPACWASAMALAPRVTNLMPARGERVAVVGCGTSYNVARAYACLREAAGEGPTDAMPASELLRQRQYERFVFLSRSGTTTEILGALASVPKGVMTLAITADGNSPLASTAGSAVVLDFADERSVVQTRFATSLLVLLRAHLGEDVAGLVEEAKVALDTAPVPAATEAQRFTFLGTGWTIGLAHEAALKLREAALAWTESYPAMEVRHGPISVLDAEAVVWSFSPLPEGLRADLGTTGALVVLPELDPLAELVRAQRLAVALAMARGLDPDRPRHLARSVILQED